MPIYEFYCDHCNTIFNFFSRTVNTRKVPVCPRCKQNKLSRQVSMFAVTGRAKEDGDTDDLPFDEGRVERPPAVVGDPDPLHVDEAGLGVYLDLGDVGREAVGG